MYMYNSSTLNDQSISTTKTSISNLIVFRKRHYFKSEANMVAAFTV